MDHRAKKILILYASAGHGHEKAAHAIEEALIHQGHSQVRCLDTLPMMGEKFGNWYRQSYLMQIRWTPWLWGFFYHLIDIRLVYLLAKPVRRLFNRLFCRKLENLLISENADTLISTHFMSTEVAGHLKDRQKIKGKLITVVTDYLPHRIWIGCDQTTYAVATEETRLALSKRGVSTDAIAVTGIPVSHKFLLNNNRETLIQKLDLKKNLFTVLLTSGGAGIGAIRRIATGLISMPHPVQTLVVCGTNKKLRATLSRLTDANPLLKVFGFVDNMDELMDASDLLVGKGGGITISEALVKGKPMILFQSVPGQETRNAVCVKRYGAGLSTDSSDEVVDMVADLASHPDRLEAFKKRCAQMSRPEAAQKIAAMIA